MKLTIRHTAIALSVFAAASFAGTPATSTNSFNAGQTHSIEKIVHDYIVNNPEILIEASQALQMKQQQMMQQKAEEQIEKHHQALFSGKNTLAGNPKGNVTLVEFFDYQCGHCKKMAPVVKNLMKQDKNLRVIYREYPIFGGDSDLAAKAALAAGLQNKYTAMHDTLISEKSPLNEDIINKAAQKIGLNMTQFKKDLESQAVQTELNANQELAKALNLAGTPAFIIAKTPNGMYKANSKPVFIPGAASFDVLQDLIKKAQR